MCCAKDAVSAKNLENFNRLTPLNDICEKVFEDFLLTPVPYTH